MSKARQGLGRLGERLAEEKLKALGYEIVARNFRAPGGEIDLVAQREAEWTFVEVRARRGGKYGSPEESLTSRKKTRLIRAAETYIEENGLGDVAWRIDFVAVEFSKRGELLRVEVIENAVSG
jgi:putative endonuclease